LLLDNIFTSPPSPQLRIAISIYSHRLIEASNRERTVIGMQSGHFAYTEAERPLWRNPFAYVVCFHHGTDGSLSAIQLVQAT
jgi:hypothetical protein